MWVYRTGPRDGPAIILYDYQATRAGKHPRHFLAHFTGFLQVDAYAGYDAVRPPGLAGYAAQARPLILVGCWAHARRKFSEALIAVPPAQRDPLKPTLASDPACSIATACSKSNGRSRRVPRTSDFNSGCSVAVRCSTPARPGWTRSCRPCCRKVRWAAPSAIV